MAPDSRTAGRGRALDLPGAPVLGRTCRSVSAGCATGGLVAASKRRRQRDDQRDPQPIAGTGSDGVGRRDVSLVSQATPQSKPPFAEPRRQVVGVVRVERVMRPIDRPPEHVVTRSQRPSALRYLEVVQDVGVVLAGCQGRNSQLAGHGCVKSGTRQGCLGQELTAAKPQEAVRSLYTNFGQPLSSCAEWCSSYRVARATPCAAFVMMAATACGWDT